MSELLLLLTLKICQKIKVSEFQVKKDNLQEHYCFFWTTSFLTLKNMPKNQGEWILSAEGRAQPNFFSLYLPDFENAQNLTTNKHLLFLTLKYWVSELLLFWLKKCKKTRWMNFKRRGRTQTNFFSLYWSNFKNVQIVRTTVFFSPLKNI